MDTHSPLVGPNTSGKSSYMFRLSFGSIIDSLQINEDNMHPVFYSVQVVTIFITFSFSMDHMFFFLKSFVKRCWVCDVLGELSIN